MRSGPRGTLGIVAALTFSIVGCRTDAILHADFPDLIAPSAVNTPEGARALRNAAIATFADAYTGTTQPGVITIAGVLSDELVAASPLELPQIDARATDPRLSFLQQHMRFEMRAIGAAAQAVAALDRYLPAPRSNVGQMYALAAMMETMVAEEYCSGVAIGSVANGAVAYGPPLTTEQLLSRAVATFDSALGALPGPDSAAVEGLSLVGKARALLDLGRYAEAVATVSGLAPHAAVNSDFVYATEHSADSQSLYNGVYVWMTSSRWFSVADREGGVGLPFRSDHDPRAAIVSGGLGIDLQTPFFAYAKYSQPSSSAVVANGVEARLIEAEGRLAAGDVDGSLAALNALRARVVGLQPLAGPRERDGLIDVLFKERAYWLFGTGHRLGDLRRLVRQYGRSAESVFPSGRYPSGGEYGTDVNLPIPYDEQANPLARNGCFDRGA